MTKLKLSLTSFEEFKNLIRKKTKMFNKRIISKNKIQMINLMNNRMVKIIKIKKTRNKNLTRQMMRVIEINRIIQMKMLIKKTQSFMEMKMIFKSNLRKICQSLILRTLIKILKIWIGLNSEKIQSIWKKWKIKWNNSLKTLKNKTLSKRNNNYE